MSPAPDPSPVRPPRLEARRAPTLVSSFGFAWEGVVRTAQRERNMRVHLFAALCVGLAGMEVRFGTAARLALLLAVALVIAAEVLNSALEAVVDLHTTAYHPKAKIAKDAAAGAVLVLAAGAVFVGVAVIVDAWPEVRGAAGSFQRHLGAHLVVLVSAARLALPLRRRVYDASALASASIAALALAVLTGSVVFTALVLGVLAVSGAAALSPRRSA